MCCKPSNSVCEVIKEQYTVFICCTVTSLRMGSSSNNLKWPFPLCLRRMTTVSLSYPVLSFVPSTFLSQKHVSGWKPEIRIPHGSEYVVLSGLDWNTEYEVHVVAENQQGKSEPGILSFRTATEPTTIPGTIPIISPRASTHTSHIARRLPPWPEILNYLDPWPLPRAYLKLAGCRVWLESSVSVCWGRCVIFLLPLLVHLVTKWKCMIQSPLKWKPRTILFDQSNKSFM